MAEVEISYKGSNIATMNASGAKTLLTEAKYLEDDVTVTYTRPAAPSGTKNISITANGQTTEDVTAYASAQITANVPNTYAAGDEGKVVSSGALVSQTSRNIDTNGTYDTTTNNEVVVNVSGGGGGDLAAFLSGNAADGMVTLYDENALSVRDCGIRKAPQLVTINLPNCTKLYTVAIYGNTKLEHLYLPKVTALGGTDTIASNGKLRTLVLPSLSGATGYAALRNNGFYTLDLGVNVSTLSDGISGATSLATIILRRTAGVCALASVATLNSSLFASGKSGGVLYVPSALIDSYKAASNWATILGYENNQIKSIESTHTDPNAPFDMTIYYADGTLIPTT